MSENGTRPAQQDEAVLAQQVLTECTKAVNSYRDGTISKAKAILSISTQLVNVESQQTGAAEDVSTIQSYLAMLDEVDRRRNPGLGGEAREPIRGPSERRTKGAGNGGGDASTPQSPQSSERSRSCEASSEVDEPRAKRARVNPAKYAWAATDFLLETRLHPNIIRTLDLIKIYGEDLPQAKRDVSASPSAPEFPEFEWTNVLTGRAVDLDHVFTGRYTAAAEEKVTEHVGGLEVSFRALMHSSLP
ncbi:hypothetical protein TRAPUB_11401 [Trametes pubescens]|uniref:Uncharacterized protein n=1 Tax=Trametes pubescens TaxID=154538 RepID=A0A1M2VWR0_TRAPU|nr:hypothetical protein TRAPUB_11401 [Trametes pubescens]